MFPFLLATTLDISPAGIHFLEMFHPDRETLSDVGRTAKVRLDNDLTSPLSMVSPIAMKRHRVRCRQ